MKIIFVFCFLTFSFLIGGEGYANDQVGFQIEMLPWKEINILLPKYSKFTVMDVETGKRFRVQRRAGSHHADVQPLSAQDTKIMKRIYGGKWSWKRRSIIIIFKDRWYAASMHGMPHGGGALINNFPGHFCIHFYGSTTHGTNSMDLAHMLMIYKSAGRLEEYFWKADPYEVIEAFITGLKQQDQAISAISSLQKINWNPVLEKIENAAIIRISRLPPEDLTNEISLDIPIEIEMYGKNIGRKKYFGKIHLLRFSQYQPWKIDANRFLKENNLKVNLIRH